MVRGGDGRVGVGGALKGVGLTRRAGEAVSRAADFIDPVSLTGKAIGATARGAQPGLRSRTLQPLLMRRVPLALI